MPLAATGALTPQTIPLLCAAAFVAGAMNSVAGGGSFFSFPALLLCGMDARLANATNTVALWPGSLASAGAYRREQGAQRPAVRLLAPISLAGGLAGALLLLVTPSTVFRVILPYLMLGATLLFAFSPQLNNWIRHRDHRREATHHQREAHARWRSILLQLLISVYGGFFGGGIGILMLATLALMEMEDIHEMNAVKTVLAALINGIAAFTFVAARAVVWPHALMMMVAGIAGGYGGATLARRVRPSLVRGFIVATGLAVSVYLLIH